MTDTTPAPGPARIARFMIDDRVYTSAALDEVSLRDMLLFEGQAKDIGLSLTWGEIEDLAQRVAGETDANNVSTQDGLTLTAATVWASRRAAGDDVTFGEAIDVPVNRIRFLRATEDHRPDPSKARKPKKGSKARKDSGPLVEDAPPATPLEDAAESETTETSEPLSVPD